jgi:hypothetical protein
MPTLTATKAIRRRLTLAPLADETAGTAEQPAREPAGAPAEPVFALFSPVPVEKPTKRPKACKTPVTASHGAPTGGRLLMAAPVHRVNSAPSTSSMNPPPFRVRNFLAQGIDNPGPLRPSTPPAAPSPSPSVDWMPEADRLEALFFSMKLPEPPVRLNAHTTISDLRAFVLGHVATLKAQRHSSRHSSFLDRLLALEIAIAPPDGNIRKPGKLSRLSNTNTPVKHG